MSGGDVLGSELLERIDGKLLSELHGVRVLASLNDEQLCCLIGSEVLEFGDGEALLGDGGEWAYFWIILSGEVSFFGVSANGKETLTASRSSGSTFGDLGLMSGSRWQGRIRSRGRSRLLRLKEEAFWSMMTTCPMVRQAILRDWSSRGQILQTRAAPQEEMGGLGTMAAGVMHELKNPGTAAQRAAAQLRSNLERMHALSVKFARAPLSKDQKGCLLDLEERAMGAKATLLMNSLEQTDAEDALAAWMDEAGIEDSWRLAPALVAAGVGIGDLECARGELSKDLFADALSWVEAMVSSLQLTGTIEETVGRVSALIHAVKAYAYDGRGRIQRVDVNSGIHATLVMLGHKIREKDVVVEKKLAKDLPQVETDSSGLNQVWTNLLDNAIDAVGQGGRVCVKTWSDVAPEGESGGGVRVWVAITDDGGGIPLESQGRIFEPYYTTKAAGVGTGLGLYIVQRIMDQFGGTIRSSSAPGETEFVVMLPVRRG